jgi:hypothetical protein
MRRTIATTFRRQIMIVEIAADAIAQARRLADIQQLTVGGVHAVHAGTLRQRRHVALEIEIAVAHGGRAPMRSSEAALQIRRFGLRLLIGGKLGIRSHAQAQMAQDTVIESVDQAMHRDRLAAPPGILHHRGLTTCTVCASTCSSHRRRSCASTGPAAASSAT